ncbi:hypothetical protein AAMO2058_000301100 [Amorphochlora amoebiformis]
MNPPPFYSIISFALVAGNCQVEGIPLKILSRNIHLGKISRAVSVRGGEDGIRMARRRVLGSVLGGAVGLGLGAGIGGREAKAGMVMFPPENLNNRYFLLRAGEDDLQSRNTIITNKVYINSFEHGLTSKGKKQIVTAYENLISMTGPDEDLVLWPSIQFNCYQSATLIAELWGLGQNRIVPEYTFLDPRGMGTFEGGPLSKYDFVHEKDQTIGMLYKPPRNDDGTDNESVNDVFIRVRQAMSITETQFSGRTVVFISPDSDNLSVLEAALRAKDSREFLWSLSNHNRFAYAPGEIREVGIGPIQTASGDKDSEGGRTLTNKDVEILMKS